MWIQGIAKRSRSDPDGRKGCVPGQREMAGEFLAWICGQFSSGCGRKVQEKNEDHRRRRGGMHGGENRFLGGSDPTLSGMEAAQRLPAPGVATAQGVQQISSLRRRQSCKQTTRQD